MAPTIIQPPKPGLDASPEVRSIHWEGDELSKRLAAMHVVRDSEAFKALAPLDAHLFMLQMEVMQSYLHVLTIRLARANDRANSILPDTASALGKKPLIIKPGDIN